MANTSLHGAVPPLDAIFEPERDLGPKNLICCTENVIWDQKTKFVAPKTLCWTDDKYVLPRKRDFGAENMIVVICSLFFTIFADLDEGYLWLFNKYPPPYSCRDFETTF